MQFTKYNNPSRRRKASRPVGLEESCRRATDRILEDELWDYIRKTSNDVWDRKEDKDAE